MLPAEFVAICKFHHESAHVFRMIAAKRESPEKFILATIIFDSLLLIYNTATGHFSRVHIILMFVE